MYATFSEFSYGFALSYEIMNALIPIAKGAPLFPSLLEEAKKGYDVNFTMSGWPLFLQFKLAKYMTRRNSMYWSDFSAPHFRINIHRRNISKQHECLRELSKIESEVYYVAPNFISQADFNQYFISDNIMMRSHFFPLSKLPNITDDLQHHITYKSDFRFFWHSDHPFEFQLPTSGEYFLGHLAQVQPKRLDRRYFLGLRSALIDIVIESSGQNDIIYQTFPTRSIDSPLTTIIRDIRHIATTYYGTEVILFINR